MNKLVESVGDQIIALLSENPDNLEKDFLEIPQVECPVIHRFGPGIYIREVFIPAGTFSIGHFQKQEHLNILLKGRVTMLDDDGHVVERVAPFMYVGKPGRKMGYIHEDMVWQNIYATTETDIEKLESMFLEKSQYWSDYDENKNKLEMILNQSSRDDYKSLIHDMGMTEEQDRDQTEDTADQIPFPHGGYKVIVSNSTIEGKGLFATADIEEGEIIAPARIGDKRTPAGRFTNHSINPNAVMKITSAGMVDLIAIMQIKGCRGGRHGEEITIDYRHSVKVAIQCLEDK